MNITTLTKTPESDIRAMKEGDVLVRELLIEGPWKHELTRHEQCDVWYCCQCDEEYYRDVSENSCTVPPPLPKPLEVYAFELVREVWGDCRIRYVAKMADSGGIRPPKFTALSIIKAALIARKREIG